MRFRGVARETGDGAMVGEVGNPFKSTAAPIMIHLMNKMVVRVNEI